MTEHAPEEVFSIPEMLGFKPIPYNRKQAYSRRAYQAMYVLYEEEAQEILRTFAPDQFTAKTAHPYIDKALGQRFIDDVEYRERVQALMATPGKPTGEGKDA